MPTPPGDLAVTPLTRSSRLARAGRWLCLGGAALGAMGLLGWTVGPREVITVIPGGPPMMPNTALSLLLVGSAGALRHRARPGRIPLAIALTAAVIVLVLAVLTVAQYALGVDLGVDHLLLRSGEGPYPDRMSPPTALALAALAGAVLILDTRPAARARPSEWLALTAAVTGFGVLVGFVLGAEPVYRWSHGEVIGVALPTAGGLLLIALGLLAQRPAGGLMRVVTAPGPGSMQLRRLALPTLVGPVLLAGVAERVIAALGLGEVSLVLAILTATATAGLLGLLLVTAIPLNRVHAALAATQESAHALFAQAPDGIFVADLAGRYTDVNAAGCRLLGYEPSELVGKAIVDLLRPEDVDRLSRDRDALATGGTVVGEWQLRRKDGSLLDAEVSARILPDGRWQGLVRDVGARKRAAAAEREASERFDLALRGADLGSWDWDMVSGRVVFNARWAELRGYRLDEVVGHVDSWITGVHPDDWPRVQATLADYVAGRTPEYDCEHRVRTRSGAWIWILDRGKVFARDDRGLPTRMVGTELDITIRKRLEHEQRLLAELGPLLVTVLDHELALARVAQLVVRDLADLCVFDLVDDTGELRRLAVDVSNPGLAWVGDVLRRASVDHATTIARALDAKAPILIADLTSEEIDAWAADESQRRAVRAMAPRSAMVVPLLTRDAPVGVLTLISASPRRYDAVDLRLAEEIARRTALTIENARLYRTATRAVKARDDILGVVAHDLRNPLGAILLQTERLRRQGGEPERRSRKPVDAIERAASRMRHLIQDLLDVTRLEAGHLVTEPDRVATTQILHEVVEAHRPRAASGAHELCLQLPDDDLPAVWADRERLRQIFENLIGNALQFTPPGGRVTIGASPRGRDLVFWVADTGVGISVEQLPHLFDRFWQASPSGRQGAGLGLPIVKGLVEAHGGRVWVESAVGRGTTFFFTLPTASQAGEPRPVDGAELMH